VRLIKKPITTTEAAVSVRAQTRVRYASRSGRSREKRHATAPSTTPAIEIGAITSQYRSRSMRRDTISPFLVRPRSLRENGIRRVG
jgi:hypothetical protein